MSTETPAPGTYLWTVTVRIGSSSMDSSGAYTTDGKRPLTAIREEIRQHRGEELARLASMAPDAALTLAELVHFDFKAA